MSAPLSPTGTKEARVHRSNIEEENASLSLVGVATAILYVPHLADMVSTDARKENGQVCGL